MAVIWIQKMKVAKKVEVAEKVEAEAFVWLGYPDTAEIFERVFYDRDEAIKYASAVRKRIEENRNTIGVKVLFVVWYVDPDTLDRSKRYVEDLGGEALKADNLFLHIEDALEYGYIMRKKRREENRNKIERKI